jgi:hypothetical protein
LTENLWGKAAGPRLVACALFFAVLSLLPGRAAAEKVVAIADGWQFFSDGRMGGFASWTRGDGYPQPTYDYAIDPATGQRAVDANGNPVLVPVHTTLGGAGFTGAPMELHYKVDPSLTNNAPIYDQGTIDTWRIRSGFIGNVLGFGVRGQLTPNTKISTYIQIWSFIENEGRVRSTRSLPDIRQGWAKLEGPWGAFAAGRVRGLFSRGASDIDVLYAHRWGVGWPGSIGNIGPTQGMVGFGVLGSGFSSALVYTTPSLGGLKLDIGAYDPAVLPAFGAWNRTKYPRPEAELTFERGFGNGLGKIVLFANGAYQKVYKDGQCTPIVDGDTMVGTTLVPGTQTVIGCDATVAGAGYGGRFEIGNFHLGLAGHYGQGIGLNYALQADQAAQDFAGNLRRIAGWYAQAQVVLGKFDVFAGWGLAQIFMTDYDKKHRTVDPRGTPNPNDPTMTRLVEQWSVPKFQMGINGGIVLNATQFVHFDIDVFRAQAQWYGANGFAAEKQVVWAYNGGMTVNW